MILRDLIRPGLAALEPYPPPPTIEMLEERLGRRVVKLDANENPYGPTPRVHEALRHCTAERYPDAGCTLLRQRLGEFLPTDPDRIVCGVGGDEILDLLARVFLDAGDEVIDCTPSFVMYRVTTLTNGGRVIAVPRGE
ncbi:MAG TPA: aminotransferase class I/II-fold pyridoxal phosphate-dependent enzyme, partial [Chloroflexota bacterium]